jgi:integrase
MPGCSSPVSPTGAGFHALRHYYASLLIHHDENIKTIQTRLGHGSARETLDTYAHLWPDSEDRTRAALDEALGSVACRPRVTTAEAGN